MDIGLLLLRILLGALLFGHAMQKLTGAFHGHGPAGTAPIFETWGLRPGRPLVLVAGSSELLAAGLITLGLAVPLGTAIAVGTMTVAASVNVAKGLWATGGGYELPLVYGGVAAGLGFTGAGSWSVDHSLGWSYNAGIGAAALFAGLAAAGLVIGYAARNKTGRNRTKAPQAA